MFYHVFSFDSWKNAKLQKYHWIPKLFLVTPGWENCTKSVASYLQQQHQVLEPRAPQNTANLIPKEALTMLRLNTFPFSFIHASDASEYLHWSSPSTCQQSHHSALRPKYQCLVLRSSGWQVSSTSPLKVGWSLCASPTVELHGSPDASARGTWDYLRHLPGFSMICFHNLET